MDFLGDVFGTSSASLFEGLNRVVGDGLSAQDWFATKKAEAVPVKLPWEASTAEELPYERQLREAVLLISQSPQVFLQDASQEVSELPADTFASAGAVLEADEGLRHLRFRLVPKFCSEEQFWNAYFARVARVKEQVKAEQMWGDFDMLSEEEEGEEGQLHVGLDTEQVAFANKAKHISQWVQQSTIAEHGEDREPHVLVSVQAEHSIQEPSQEGDTVAALDQRQEDQLVSCQLSHQDSTVSVRVCINADHHSAEQVQQLAARTRYSRWFTAVNIVDDASEQLKVRNHNPGPGARSVSYARLLIDCANSESHSEPLAA